MKHKKTKFFNNVERKWVVIDAKDMVLGRLATRIAKILQGKTKACYSPNFLCGDKVIVVNAKHVKITATKLDTKVYQRYTGYPGGRRTMTMRVMMEKNPVRILHWAVKGMLPNTALGNHMLKYLKIYPEQTHNHQAQMPQTVNV